MNSPSVYKIRCTICRVITEESLASNPNGYSDTMHKKSCRICEQVTNMMKMTEFMDKNLSSNLDVPVAQKRKRNYL